MAIKIPSMSAVIQQHIDVLTKANELINGVLTHANPPLSKEKMLGCFKVGISETVSYVEEWKKDDNTLLKNIQEVFKLATCLENAYLCFTENKLVDGQDKIKEAVQLESFLPENERVSAIVFKKMWELKGKPQGDKAGETAFYATDANPELCKQAVGDALIKFGWTYRTAQNFLLNCKDVIEPPQQQQKQPKADSTSWASWFKWLGFASVVAAIVGLIYYIFKDSSEQV